MVRQRMLACTVVLASSCGPLVETNGHQEKAAQHNSNRDCELDTMIARLEEQKVAAKNDGDVIAFQKAQLSINYYTELKESRSVNAKMTQRQVESKYTILGQILADELERFNTPGSWQGAELARGLQSGIEYKDVPYVGPDFTSVYHPRVLEQVNRVFADFGDLYVNVTEDSHGRSVTEEVRVRKPWSGYWYPFSNASTLYEGPDSPLAKFDALLAKMGYDSQVAASERDRYKGFTPDGWEGLCDAWSLAAMTPEPTHAIKIDGIRFSIADQKALRTYSHLKYSKVQYGLTYRGDADSDGTFQDIKPEAFHRIVTKVLGEEGRAIVIDDMAGIQVWNKPLYRYRWKITQDPNIEYAFNVRAYPWLVKERTSETDELTNDNDAVAPIYNYRLYVDKSVVNDGKYKVIAGQWVGESFYNHPDSVTYPLLNGDIGSHNSEFNKYIAIYRQVFLDRVSK